jgi:predicted dithiol-disulfide oxidoreductase (DUF899 family)
MQHDIVSRNDWLSARTALLAAEKELAETRASVVEQRRTLPWTAVEKKYEFDTPAGRRTLAELFDGRGRLIVYRLLRGMAGGLPRCSPGDHLDGMPSIRPPARPSLRSRRADRQDRGPHRKDGDSRGCHRNCDFNYDYRSRSVRVAAGSVYGYELCKIDKTDLPGTSVFGRNAAGELFHAYSAYFNGGDMPLSVNYPDLLG